MTEHGGSMLTMAVVVAGLFAVEFAFGVLPPFPTTSPRFEQLVETPTFWTVFVVNLGAAIAVAYVVTSE